MPLLETSDGQIETIEWGNGPDQVLQMVEERAPQGFQWIKDVLTHKELEDTAEGYKRVAGFDKEALNSRPSIVAM